MNRNVEVECNCSSTSSSTTKGTSHLRSCSVANSDNVKNQIPFVKGKIFSLPYEICNDKSECFQSESRKICCEQICNSNNFRSVLLHANEQHGTCVDAKIYSNLEYEDENSGTTLHVDHVEYVSKINKNGFNRHTNTNLNHLIVPQMTCDEKIVFTKNNTFHNFLHPNTIVEIDLNSEEKPQFDSRNTFSYKTKSTNHNDFSIKERMNHRYLRFAIELEKSQAMDLKFENYVTMYAINGFPRYKKPKHIASIDWILHCSCSITDYITKGIESKKFINGIEYCEEYLFNESSHWLFSDLFNCCQILKTLSAHCYFDEIQERKLVYIPAIERCLNNSLYDPTKEINEIQRDFDLCEGFEISENENMYRNHNGKNPQSFYTMASGLKTVRLQTDSQHRIRNYLQESTSHFQYYADDNNTVNEKNNNITVAAEKENPYINSFKKTDDKTVSRESIYVNKKHINRFG